jgi:Protein of unknown function (DUF2510)
VEAPQGGERHGGGLVVALGLPAAGALLGLAAGFLLLGSLPGRDAAGTALVLLVATAAGLAVGVLLALIGLWRARSRRPKPEPAAERAPEPRRARARRSEPEPAPPPPEPEPEPELPPPADRTPGWQPDPAGGPDRRYWDGERWTDHRWRPRR